MSSTVLILGGTAEARALAGALVAADVPVVSSLAGRVRDPALPAAVREAGIRMAAVVIVGPALAAAHFPDSHLYSDARCRPS